MTQEIRMRARMVWIGLTATLWLGCATGGEEGFAADADGDLVEQMGGADGGGSLDAARAVAMDGALDALGDAAADGGWPDAATTLDAAALDGAAILDGAGEDAGEDDGGWPDAADDPDGRLPAPPPVDLDPCDVGRCWLPDRTFGASCGDSTLPEDFSTGRYNVHGFGLVVTGGVAVELTLTATGGAWSPALLLHDPLGETLSDGERGLQRAPLRVEVLATGRDGDPAVVRIEAGIDRQLTVFLTSWEAIDGGFGPDLPRDARYRFTVSTDCDPPEGEALLSPPNLDEDDVVGGYLLLPPSDPAGLYTRKADGCSRGTRLLIDVLYTVASRWSGLRPEYAPIAFRDLNRGPCSTVNHATHNDGTHADLVAGCATSIACDDVQPAIDLAKLFVDTGQICGILFNDAAVQAEVNAYFVSRYGYEPWHGTFMRSVEGHVRHFHVRVKMPDGGCN